MNSKRNFVQVFFRTQRQVSICYGTTRFFNEQVKFRVEWESFSHKQQIYSAMTILSINIQICKESYRIRVNLSHLESALISSSFLFNYHFKFSSISMTFLFFVWGFYLQNLVNTSTCDRKFTLIFVKSKSTFLFFISYHVNDNPN